MIQILNARLLGLLEQLEGALLGDVARLLELSQSLLARRVLLLADNATLARLHQVLLGQATGSVLGGAVVDLSLGADSRRLAALHILARHVRGVSSIRRVRGVHFFYTLRNENKRESPLDFKTDHLAEIQPQGNSEEGFRNHVQAVVHDIFRFFIFHIVSDTVETPDGCEKTKDK